MSVSLVKCPQVGTFITRTETRVAYRVLASGVVTSGAARGRVWARIQEPTSGPIDVSTEPHLHEFHALDTFRAATEKEIASWHAVDAIMNPADETDNECEGHESLAGDKMGESEYCDGTCVTQGVTDIREAFHKWGALSE